MKEGIFILFLFCAFIGSANAGLIHFDDLAEQAGVNTYNIGDTYQFEDYQIKGTSSWPSTNAGFHVYQSDSLNWTGSIGLSYFDVSGRIELTTISGGLFGIDSINLSRGDQNTGLIPVGFVGNKVDGTQVFQTYNFTDTIIGKSDTFNFSEDFNNLISLVWYQGAEWHQFDNIVINSVPEPSTILLLFLSVFLFWGNDFIKKAHNAPLRGVSFET
jgi:hypothetical protein